MTSARTLFVLAAVTAATASAPSTAEQESAGAGWFQLPGGAATPAVITTSPVPLLNGPALPSGLIASEGEDFEIVKLRYADVSEIVGLLTANQTIKSNDEFSPQEPNFGSSSAVGNGYFGSGGGLPATPILSAPNGIVISISSRRAISIRSSAPPTW